MYLLYDSKLECVLSKYIFVEVLDVSAHARDFLESICNGTVEQLSYKCHGSGFSARFPALGFSISLRICDISCSGNTETNGRDFFVKRRPGLK